MEKFTIIFDVYDAFILKFACYLSAKQMAELTGLSCTEISERYDSLFFIHPSRQTPIDMEYHKRCDKLLKGFPPAVRAKGLINKKE